MILGVDDDPAFVEQAFTNLPRTDRVYFASDANHAAGVLRSGVELAVALVDLDLPGTSGFDLIHRMRQSDSALPLLAISGVYCGEVLESAKALGANETLRKPFTPAWNSVIDRVRRAGR